MGGWIRIHFNADGLSSARLTRRFPTAQTWTSAGARQHGEDDRFYHVGYRITGLPPMVGAFVKRTVSNQYPGTRVLHSKGSDWLAHVPMPAERMWSDRMQSLEALAPFGERFHTHGKGGWMDLYAYVADDQTFEHVYAHILSKQRPDSEFDICRVGGLPDGPWPEIPSGPEEQPIRA